MTRYGFRDEANRLSTALIDVASCSDHRLPAALYGYPRGYAGAPGITVMTIR